MNDPRHISVNLPHPWTWRRTLSWQPAALSSSWMLSVDRNDIPSLATPFPLDTSLQNGLDTQFTVNRHSPTLSYFTAFQPHPMFPTAKSSQHHMGGYEQPYYNSNQGYYGTEWPTKIDLPTVNIAPRLLEVSIEI